MKIASKELQLANGEIIPVGMNFLTLKLMTKYPGGLNVLQKKMLAIKTEDQESEKYGELLVEGMEAMGYMLYALVRSGGTQTTQEQCEMAISPDDFTELYSVFEEFNEASKKDDSGKKLDGPCGEIDFVRLIHTAKALNLSIEEFWDMNPIEFTQLVGYELESRGQADPNRIGFIDD